jgi:hypothetical protein
MALKGRTGKPGSQRRLESARAERRYIVVTILRSQGMAIQDITRAVMNWHKMPEQIPVAGSPSSVPPELSPIDNSSLMVSVGPDGDLSFKAVGFEPLVNETAKFDTVRKYVANDVQKWNQELTEEHAEFSKHALVEYVHAKRRFMQRLFAIVEEPRPFNNVLQATALKLIDKVMDDIATASGADIRGRQFDDDRDIATREAYEQARLLAEEWEKRREALRKSAIDVVATNADGSPLSESETGLAVRQARPDLPPELRTLFNRISSDPNLAAEIKDLADRYYQKHTGVTVMPERQIIPELDEDDEETSDGLPVV